MCGFLKKKHLKNAHKLNVNDVQSSVAFIEFHKNYRNGLKKERKKEEKKIIVNY